MSNSDPLGPDQAYDLVHEFDFQMFSDIRLAKDAVQKKRFEDVVSHLNGVEDFAKQIIEVGEDSSEDHYIEYGEFILDSCQELREAIENDDFEEIDQIFEVFDHTGPQSFYSPVEDD